MGASQTTDTARSSVEDAGRIASEITFRRDYDRFALYVDPQQEVAVALRVNRRTDGHATVFAVDVLFRFRNGPEDELFTLVPVPSWEVAGSNTDSWYSVDGLKRAILNGLAVQEFAGQERRADFTFGDIPGVATPQPVIVYKGSDPQAVETEVFFAKPTPWKAYGQVEWSKRHEDSAIGQLIDERIPASTRELVEGLVKSTVRFNPAGIQM